MGSPEKKPTFWLIFFNLGYLQIIYHMVSGATVEISTHPPHPCIWFKKKNLQAKSVFIGFVGGRVSKKTFWAVDFFRATVLIPEAVPYGNNTERYIVLSGLFLR